MTSSASWKDRALTYLLAVALAILSLWLRVLAVPWLDQRNIYIFFFPAIIGMALVGGFVPGVICLVTCALGTAYYFHVPVGSFKISTRTDIASEVTFVVVSCLLVAMAGQQRKLRFRLNNTAIELGRARDEALAASEAKSRFLAVMSHELRTPLNAVIGYAELLQDEMEVLGKKEYIRDLDRIHASGHHLLTLLNDLLDMARIESGKLEITMEDVEAGELIVETVKSVAPLLADKSVVLRSEACPGTVRADRTRLRQVLLNLLFNAIKFTSEGGITLRCERITNSGTKYIRFDVSDTGPGIAPEEMPKLFRNFSQLDSSSTRKYGGAGLGLAISRELCEAMGGEMTVHSTPGKGSTFSFRLPVGSDLPAKVHTHESWKTTDPETAPLT